MDPDANLREQREIVARINARNDRKTDDGYLQANDTADQLDDGERLAELVDALDGWLTAGGAKPALWTGHAWPQLEPKR